MASIFNSLHIGYSGLNAAQVGINTTSHNITNAETEGYSRQRVVTAVATPLSSDAGQVGNGTQVVDVKRVFDNFVFDRYNDISADKEYSDFETKTLETLSTYFPEIDGVGVKSDLTEFYNMWQTFADNPNNDAIKVALAKQTETLTQHIAQTQDQVSALQSSINEELITNVNEVNRLAEELANLNRSIDTAESGGLYDASDLRDQRNVIERSLSRLIGAEVNSGQLSSNIHIDSSSNTVTGSYSLSVNGFNLVDGSSFHPIHADNSNNPSGFYELSYERQDGVLIPLAEEINGGKIGAIFDLRGGAIDSTSGVPVDGVIQQTVAELDAFAKTLIESTNNLYAASPVTNMQSNTVSLSSDIPLLNSNLNINEGSFDIIVYDIDGHEVAKREIAIDNSTSMDDIKADFEEQKDDNQDGNATNDIDDFFDGTFIFSSGSNGDSTLYLSLADEFASSGYTFAIADKLVDESFSSGTNFAGAMGMNRYFDGTDADSMSLNTELSKNPTKISGGTSPVNGDNTMALSMVQHQFEEFTFVTADMKYDSTTYEMFDIIATEVGTATNSAIGRNETISTQFNATQMEYFSVSKVSIDEEMTNLIKYQTAYGASAKIITTIDQMMETLLGIKR